VRKTIFKILYYIGIGHILHLFNIINNKIPILLFHRVSEEPDFVWPTINPQDFETLLSFLKKKYAFTPLNKLFERPSKNSCIIVFDDGFQDFKETALPILKKYKVPSTLFIPTKSIIENRIVWTSVLDGVFRNTKTKSVEFIAADRKHVFNLDSEESRFKAAIRTQTLLKKLPNNERIIAFDYLINNYPLDEGKNISSMGWDDINQIKEEVNIESHSHSHPYLPNLSREELIEELTQPLVFSEINLSTKFNYISYPMGGYNAETIKETSNYYKAGFAVDNNLVKLNSIGSKDYNYKIPRINVTDTNPYELFLRINGFHKLFGK